MQQSHRAQKIAFMKTQLANICTLARPKTSCASLGSKKEWSHRILLKGPAFWSACLRLCRVTHSAQTKASRSKRMVIPLPNPPMPDGQLPEECQPNLLCLKHSILAMIFFASGRAVCAIALGAGAVSFDVTALPNMFLSIRHMFGNAVTEGWPAPSGLLQVLGWDHLPSMCVGKGERYHQRSSRRVCLEFSNIPQIWTSFNASIMFFGKNMEIHSPIQLCESRQLPLHGFFSVYSFSWSIVRMLPPRRTVRRCRNAVFTPMHSISTLARWDPCVTFGVLPTWCFWSAEDVFGRGPANETFVSPATNGGFAAWRCLKVEEIETWQPVNLAGAQRVGLRACQDVCFAAIERH